MARSAIVAATASTSPTNSFPLRLASPARSAGPRYYGACLKFARSVEKSGAATSAPPPNQSGTCGKALALRIPLEQHRDGQNTGEAVGDVPHGASRKEQRKRSDVSGQTKAAAQTAGSHQTGGAGTPLVEFARQHCAPHKAAHDERKGERDVTERPVVFSTQRRTPEPARWLAKGKRRPSGKRKARRPRSEQRTGPGERAPNKGAARAAAAPWRTSFQP